jgi:phage gp29-like protein
MATELITEPPKVPATAAERRVFPAGWKRVTEIPYYAWTEFDSVGVVKAAIRQLEQGQFDRSAMLMDAMTRDDRIAGCMMMRAEALTHLPLVFNEGATQQEIDIAKEIREAWPRMVDRASLSLLNEYGLFQGLSVGENVWTYNETTKRLEFRLKVWHPRWVYWRWDTRMYHLITSEGVIPLDPTTGQWVLYAPRGLNMAYLRGLIRSLYVPWLLRQWASRDEGRYSEAYGTPIKKAKTPAGASDEDRNRFLFAVAGIGNESTIETTEDAEGKGYDVELLEAVGTGFDGFKALIESKSADIAVRILGQNLTTEVSGGSFAAAKVHANIRQDVLDGDGQSLSQAIYEFCLRPYAKFNFGNADLAPKPPTKNQVQSYWVTEPPEDKKAAAEALTALGAGVSSVVRAGLPIDGVRISERFGLPLREGDEESARRPIPADPELVNAEIVMPNEAREAMGLDAREGGDEPPAARAEAAGAEQADAEEKAAKKTQKGKEALTVPKTSPIEGQKHIDALVEDATKAAASSLNAEMMFIMSAVMKASTTEEVEANLKVVFGALDSTAFAEVLRKAMLLSEYAGKDFARDEVS